MEESMHIGYRVFASVCQPDIYDVTRPFFLHTISWIAMKTCLLSFTDTTTLIPFSIQMLAQLGHFRTMIPSSSDNDVPPHCGIFETAT